MQIYETNVTFNYFSIESFYIHYFYSNNRRYTAIQYFVEEKALNIILYRYKYRFSAIMLINFYNLWFKATLENSISINKLKKSPLIQHPIKGIILFPKNISSWVYIIPKLFNIILRILLLYKHWRSLEKIMLETHKMGKNMRCEAES